MFKYYFLSPRAGQAAGIAPGERCAVSLEDFFDPREGKVQFAGVD
jgi:hypothetical protein